MNYRLIYFASALLFATSAYAGGEHSGGHGHKADAGHHKMTVGEPGEAKNVSRTIDVEMTETEDGDMIFKPRSMEIKRGETIRFVIVNTGELEHEFVLDDLAGIHEHRELMERFPEMEHDDPNAVHLAPGEKGEIIWAFVNDGEFEFACLIPGHYESGMKGNLAVVEKLAQN